MVENKEMNQEHKFKLVGYKNFIRQNPKSDKFVVKKFHHIEFWCSDATNTSRRFSWGLGMPIIAKSDLSTANYIHASYILNSGDLNFIFTAPYSKKISEMNNQENTASIPTFNHEKARDFSNTHGFGVRAIGIEVEDAVEAFNVSVSNGGVGSAKPMEIGNGVWVSEIKMYGDVVLRGLDFGLKRLDHAVGNVWNLAESIAYVKSFTGFHEFAEFTAEDVGTAESGLNSAVLASNNEMVLLPMNEPVYGTKRKSQIQTYLEHNEGEGLQHLALVSGDIFMTLKEMRKRSSIGGFEFMPSPPPTYYKSLKSRVGDVLNDEEIKMCEELGILVDRDDQGVLLQIFTKPVGDRPTIFIEIIQRLGCMLKDEEGKTYQKGGCGGFGKGNFSALFKSIEEYEKTLETVKQPAAGVSAATS
ncbi:4-hydroxyphenylpyruvate dioxygenase-like isoform X2 [Papaver somniferum]|uniref:4-hydroxyphenylpyruvate dioxygenase-like isoform X2 n=1 Tax=Papaver somniferum TaxID=3469 RepID=UPI000E6FFA02|nr:4-hydroxyphenylpyruvate dioxygenase-like isoform X2 [Papaver somniferum]